MPQNKRKSSPISRQNPHYQDCYFSGDDGLEESLHVFVAGNEVVNRCLGCQEFHIGETGFGTGLNLLSTVLALVDHPQPLVLNWWSVEKYPLTPEQIREYLTPFSDLAELLPEHSLWWADLLEPLDHKGWHHGSGHYGQITLQAHLWFGDVLEFLGHLPARMDAWILDGHSPAVNPDMWSPAVFAGLAAASHPQADPGSAGATTFATYTAAGLVKRGLREAGFTVIRRPGHGRKRHMIQGTYTGTKLNPGAS